MCVSSVALVDIHGDGVKLLETGHSPQEEDDKASSLDRFDSPAEQVGCECFKILQNNHLIGISENFM